MPPRPDALFSRSCVVVATLRAAVVRLHFVAVEISSQVCPGNVLLAYVLVAALELPAAPTCGGSVCECRSTTPGLSVQVDRTWSRATSSKVTEMS